MELEIIVGNLDVGAYSCEERERGLDKKLVFFFRFCVFSAIVKDSRNRTHAYGFEDRCSTIKLCPSKNMLNRDGTDTPVVTYSTVFV